MELRKQLQASLGCTLPSTLTFMHPNIDALVTHIAVDVLGLEAAPDTGSTETGTREPAAILPAPDHGETVSLRIAKELAALESLLN